MAPNNLEQPNIFANPIGYFREGAERKAAETTPDAYGVRNPGLLNDIVGALTGASDEGTQQYIDKAKSEKNKKDFKDTIVALDGKFVPNQTKGEYIRQIDDLKEARRASRYATSPEGLAAAERQRINEANLAESRSQNAITNKRLDNQMEMARLERADRMDATAADLEFRRDQMMLEDQRYNERLEREFQQRRKESLMQMMQGLASLGAAFAM